jgi:DNA polymerase-1
LIIDFQNFAHRARAGFTLGQYAVVFNFMRNLRALVEMHKPDRVVLALEGHPRARHDLLTEYKANRAVDLEKDEAMVSFFRQVDVIKELLAKHFPVTLVRHHDYEADDTIYNVIKSSSNCVKFVVASNDSDFTQLLNEFSNVSLYNPMKKEFVEEPDGYDYVLWKSLRGDATDNIPGIPGLSDAKAEELAKDPVALRAFFDDPEKGKERRAIQARNFQLIEFAQWSKEEAMEMTSTQPTRDWNAVKTKFEEFAFKSIVKDGAWEKFVSTFDSLFGSAT